jgi:hypothetical protein
MCCFFATSVLRFGNIRVAFLQHPPRFPPPKSVVFLQHSKARGIAVKKVTL